jgi:RNA polymerase sigma factor (sigma-70 family)
MVQSGTERDIKRATEELMTYNQRLISIIAKRFKGRGCTHEDMMTDGMLGLHHAIQRYDPNKGYRFSTYATNWIRSRSRESWSRDSTTIARHREDYSHPHLAPGIRPETR